MPAKKRTDQKTSKSSKPASTPASRSTTKPAAPRASRSSAPGAPARRTRKQPVERLPGPPQPGAEQRAAALRILIVTPEAHPFAKTGGLAEVAAALAGALVRLGHDVTLALPRYRGVDVTDFERAAFHITLGDRGISGDFLMRRLPDGVNAVLVDVPELFDRPGLYGADGQDYPDNAFRFAAFSRATVEYARTGGQRFDVIHAHDWQTGLVPVYQKMLFAADPVVGGVPCIFTIHNLAFQGVFPSHTLPALGLGWNVFNPEALEYWGNVSLLKAGVNFSERLTTVSPNYAREVMTQEFGFGFEGVLARRAADLVGIVNGIDVERWNPAADPFVPASYDAARLEQKQNAKTALLAEVSLPAGANALSRPVIGLISRLTDQKGFDLIGACLDELLELDAAWVMLGSGERHYEEMWRRAAELHPDRVAATIGFDERLAHLIEAGADMFLMPSRFEPCGLNQLYSLRYGTVPIVRATGGLDDTVTDADEPGGNGVKFADYTREALLGAVRRALSLYQDRARWKDLQRAGMAVDASWDVSAREYVKVYRESLVR